MGAHPREQTRVSDDLARRLVELRSLLLHVCVVLLPLPATWVVAVTADVDVGWHTAVVLQPFDVVLVGIAATTIVLLAASSERSGRTALRGPLPWVAAATLLLVGASWAATPSALGVALLLRLVAAATVVAAVLHEWRTRRAGSLEATLVVVALVQVGLGLVQIRTEGDLDLPLLVLPSDLYAFGNSLAARASFTHPYFLAAFLVVTLAVACRRALTSPSPHRYLAVGALGLGVSLTYSRSAALAVAAIGVVVLTTWRSRTVTHRATMAVAAALVVGFGIGAVGFGDGWYARAATTSDGEQIDSDRLVRAEEALDLLEEQPLFGAGAGRYVVALSERGVEDPLPAHNVVLHTAVESGIAAGVAVVALAVLLAGAVRRAGWEGAVVGVSLVPFFVLDAYPYTFPAGLVLSGLWLGLSLAPAHAWVAPSAR